MTTQTFTAPRIEVAAILMSALLIYKGGIRGRHKALDNTWIRENDSGDILAKFDENTETTPFQERLLEDCVKITNLALTHPNLAELTQNDTQDWVFLSTVVEGRQNIKDTLRMKLAHIAHQAANDAMEPITLFEAPKEDVDAE